MLKRRFLTMMHFCIIWFLTEFSQTPIGHVSPPLRKFHVPKRILQCVERMEWPSPISAMQTVRVYKLSAKGNAHSRNIDCIKDDRLLTRFTQGIKQHCSLTKLDCLGLGMDRSAELVARMCFFAGFSFTLNLWNHTFWRDFFLSKPKKRFHQWSSN